MTYDAYSRYEAYDHMARAAASAADEDLAEFRRLRYADRFRSRLDDGRLLHLGNILMSAGKKAEAIAHFEKAIEALPRSTISESDRPVAKRNIEGKIARLRS